MPSGIGGSIQQRGEETWKHGETWHPPQQMAGTKHLAQELWDPLSLLPFVQLKRPLDQPSHCDGCMAKSDLCHILQCKKGRLVIMCHNKIKDEL
jgi:hypothetical protein